MGLSKLAHQVLGVHVSMAKRWCKFRKLNISMVFKYFTKKDLPLTRADASIISMLFVFASLQAFSWCMKLFRWILEFFTWSRIWGVEPKRLLS